MAAGEQFPPVMLETWLRESGFRLPTTVILERWLRESGDLAYETFLISF